MNDRVSITREQALGMLVEALLLGEFDPQINNVSGVSSGRYVLFLRGTDIPERSLVLWGRCTDLKTFDKVTRVPWSKPHTQDEIKELLMKSDSFGAFKREEAE